MSSRARILAATRRALTDTGDLPSVPREYRGAGACALSRAALVARFEERLRDYGAEVRQATTATVAVTLGVVAQTHGASRLVIPAGLDVGIQGVSLVVDDGLSATELDAVDGVVTGCAAAIAETGTIVLDGGACCGRRALSLIPDLHVCVVDSGQIVGGVPDAVDLIQARGVTAQPLTFVSGPSATSDIGFERVEGVHGPRRLEVVVVVDDSCATEAAS